MGCIGQAGEMSAQNSQGGDECDSAAGRRCARGRARHAGAAKQPRAKLTARPPGTENLWVETSCVSGCERTTASTVDSSSRRDVVAVTTEGRGGGKRREAEKCVRK